MYGWREQNKTVVHFDQITANLFGAADYISCLKLLIIKLLIEKLNISIENWCCYLKIAILIHSCTTGDSNCPSFVPCLVSYGAFKCFPGMA